MVKFLPLAFGFGMFLAYFSRNHFYPSFDLFQFSSLLLAAACLGFGVIGIFVAAFFLSGAWVFYGFLNTKAIKEDITYALPYREQPRFHKLMLLMILIFFLPYLASGLSMLASAFLSPSLFLWVMFLGPIPAVLLAGIAVQVVFDLKPFAFWKYLHNAYLPSVAIGFLIFWMCGKTYPVVDDWVWLAKWTVLIGAPLAVAFIAALISMAFAASWNAALLFSTFFALIMAGYSGALTTLPDTVVATLGLGNYQAKAIVLDTSYCTKDQARVLPTDDQCVLKEVQVVWSLGEAFVLRLADGSTARLPAAAIRALVKPQ